MARKIIAPIIICLILLSLIISIFNSCKHDSMIEQLVQIKFSKQILPIFQANCAISGCHDGKPGDARLNLTDYNHIIKEVVPGKPYSSRIYTAIIDVYGRIMPPNRTLSEPQRTLIKVWIEQGAKNIIDTTGSDTTHSVLACDTNKITFSGTIKKIISDNCNICHSNAMAPSLGANIKLEDSADIVSKSGRIIGAIEHKKNFFAMPLGKAKLDTCKIAQFAIWMNEVNINKICDTNNITLSGKINKILNDNCLICHSNANAQSFGAAIKLQDSIDIVAKAPRILGSVQHKQGFFAMPLGQSHLDTCSITQIAIWVRKLNINTPAICDTNNITFSGTISKLLNDNCLTCHSNITAPTLGANIRLQDYTDVVSHSNRLLGSLEHLPNYFAMPLNNSKLDTCKITQIAIWIKTLKTDTGTNPPPVDTSHYAKRACFQRDILPVLVSSCALTGCHNNISRQGDYVYTSYATIMQTVQPFYPNESVLYTSINGNGEEDIMPPSGYTQLTRAQIDSIKNWISYGALDEQCFSSLCDTTNVTFSGTVWPIINSYCKGCHSSANASGGYNLDNYTSISTYAKNGILMNALRGNGVPLMPLGTTLLKCKINQVNKWVQNKTPNN